MNKIKAIENEILKDIRGYRGKYHVSNIQAVILEKTYQKAWDNH